MKQVLEKGNPKLLNAWAFYDWANSVYPLVITTAIFPIFYKTIFDVQGDGTNTILLGGISVKTTAVITFVTAAAFLVISVMSPILSGIADYIGNKKLFMRLFNYVGAASCMGLYGFGLKHIYLGLTLYALGLIGFWGSMVFYNSYLPDIAHKDQQDALSSKGFAMGYLGSILLLIVNLYMVMSPETFGMVGDDAPLQAMRLAFVCVGLWWVVFSQYTYYYLPKGGRKNTAPINVFKNGFKELHSVWLSLKANTRLRRYLAAFFVYSMGVQTVMLVATYFGQEEIVWGGDSQAKMGLIGSILVIQLIAVVGAVLTAKASKRLGNIAVLLVLNGLWFGICIFAFTIRTPVEFYTAAVLVGLVMGGIQSLSRSTYSKLLPETMDTTSFFSFYEVAEKIGIVLGMAIYGGIDQLTGSMRNAVLVLALFFLGGFMLLLKVPKSATVEPRNH